MADNVPASIEIGGRLPFHQLARFVEIVQSEELGTDWEGPPFDVADLPGSAPLRLRALEVRHGCFETLEAFCYANGLPFVRWSSGCSCAHGAWRLVFTGSGEPELYPCDESDTVLIGRDHAVRLGAMAALIAYFDRADFVVPPLVVLPDPKAAGDSGARS